MVGLAGHCGEVDPAWHPALRFASYATRATTPVLRCLPLLLIVPMLGACTEDLSCGGSDVRAVLHQALDNTYAEARTISKVDVTIKDIVSVGRSGNRISCKAVTHIDVTFLDVVQTIDPIIPYTAELTDGGQVLVIATP